MEVLSTLVLETKMEVDCLSKNLDGVFEVEEVVEVKAHDKFIDDNVVIEVRSSFESVSLNVRTNEALREMAFNVMEGEERMDSLWEIYALLDTYQSDSTTMSAQKADALIEKKKKKKKKKRTRELDPYYGNEDDCLPFKLCARKMNLRFGRTQIVKITKALKRIDLLPLHHVMKRRAWQKKQILI
ncbi:hypothetical protein AgCh_023438 [Apium graveolens]